VTKKRKTIPRSKTRRRPSKAKASTPHIRRKTGVRKKSAPKKKLRGGHDPSIGAATQFQPGVSPNPGGRPVTKPFTEALREAIFENPGCLKHIAKRILVKTMSDARFFAEVRNMLDGRPAQEVKIANPTGEDGKPVPFKVADTSSRDKLLAFLCGPYDGEPSAVDKRSLAEACRERTQHGTSLSDAEQQRLAGVLDRAVDTPEDP
jgi:hypothetical protein